MIVTIRLSVSYHVFGVQGIALRELQTLALDLSMFVAELYDSRGRNDLFLSDSHGIERAIAALVALYSFRTTTQQDTPPPFSQVVIRFIYQL